MYASEHHFLFKKDLKNTARVPFQDNQCAIYSLARVPVGNRNANLTYSVI